MVGCINLGLLQYWLAAFTSSGYNAIECKSNIVAPTNLPYLVADYSHYLTFGARKPWVSELGTDGMA